MFSMFLDATASTSTTSSMLTMFLPLIAIVAVMYFVMLRPQQKKDKQAAEMRNSIEVGDGIVTIGGLMGRVASLKEDSFVLETGTDRVKIRMKRSAILEVEKLKLDGDSSSDAGKDKDAKAAK